MPPSSQESDGSASDEHAATLTEDVREANASAEQDVKEKNESLRIRVLIARMSEGRTSREQDYSLPTCHRAVLLTMHPSLRFQVEIRAIEGGIRASGAGVKGVYSVCRYAVLYSRPVQCTRCIDVVMQRLYEAQVSQAERVASVCLRIHGYMDGFLRFSHDFLRRKGPIVVPCFLSRTG